MTKDVSELLFTKHSMSIYDGLLFKPGTVDYSTNKEDVKIVGDDVGLGDTDTGEMSPTEKVSRSYLCRHKMIYHPTRVSV